MDFSESKENLKIYIYIYLLRNAYQRSSNFRDGLRN